MTEAQDEIGTDVKFINLAWFPMTIEPIDLYALLLQELCSPTDLKRSDVNVSENN